MDIDKEIKEMKIEPLSGDFTERVMRRLKRRDSLKRWILVPALGGALIVGMVIGLLLPQKRSSFEDYLYTTANTSIVEELVNEGD